MSIPVLSECTQLCMPGLPTYYGRLGRYLSWISEWLAWWQWADNDPVIRACIGHGDAEAKCPGVGQVIRDGERLQIIVFDLGFATDFPALVTVDGYNEREWVG